MKKTLTTIAVFLTALGAADIYAQNGTGNACDGFRRTENCRRAECRSKEKCGKTEMLPQERAERIRKKAEMQFDRLMIDDSRKELFISTYTEYINSLNECREKYRNEPCMYASTDKEISEQMKNIFRKKQEILDIREKYFQEFGKFLTARQVREIFFPKKHRHDGKCESRHRHDCRKDGSAERRNAFVPETERLEDGTLVISVPSDRK